MGMMQGKVVGTSLVIIDSFALPVQGTETRVNAANEANEYMVQYIESSNRVRSSVPFAFAINLSIKYRLHAWSMQWDGITRTQATDAGYPVSM
jgi:hypothetical protein